MSDSTGAATGHEIPGEGSPSDVTPPESSTGDRDVLFSERLWVPWWGWPLPLTAAILLAAEVHLGYPGVRAWLPYLITIPVTVAALIWLGRARVEVSGGELRVGTAHVPLEHLGQVDICSGSEKRKALGPELDPTAFVMHRGWVRSVLRVELVDPREPAPYWVFSTRSPGWLAQLLRTR